MFKVYRHANLKWDNLSFWFPNKIPTNFLEEKISKKRPTMHNALSGTVDLVGDNWNLCQWNGVWYQLKRVAYLNIKTKRCRYALTYDSRLELLKHRIKVKAKVLSTWNLDELLEKNINRLLPSLPNPVRAIRTNFKSEKFDWKKHANIKKIEKIFTRRVLTSDEFEYAQQLSNSLRVQNYKAAKQIWYKSKPQIFIFGRFRGTETEDESIVWENRAKKLFNQLIEKIGTDEVAIVKVSTPSGSPLVGKYAITWKNSASLGSGVEASITKKEIDLSTLEEIIPIKSDDLQAYGINEAFSPLNVDTGIFDIPREHDIEDQDYTTWKLRRKAYLPIKSLNNKEGYFLKGSEHSHRWTTCAPQQITFSDAGLKRVGYLYWVDRLDFSLTYMNYYQDANTSANSSAIWLYATLIIAAAFIAAAISAGALAPASTALGSAALSATSIGATTTAKTVLIGNAIKTVANVGKALAAVSKATWASSVGKAGISAGLAYGLGFGSTAELIGNLENLKPSNFLGGWPIRKEIGLGENGYSTFTPTLVRGDYEQDYFFNYLPPEKVPGYGWLIWQFDKNPSDWRGIEYKGIRKLKKLEIFTGLNKFLITHLKKDNKWWANLHPKAYQIGGDELIAKLHCDLDCLSWLYFAPIDQPRSYEYAWHSEDTYGVFWNGEGHWKDKKWVAKLVRADLIGKEGAAREQNPFTAERIDAHNEEKRRTLKDITLRDVLDLDESTQLSAGDYFFSSLEYEFKPIPGAHWVSFKYEFKSMDLTKQFKEIHETNAAKNYNILGDFTDILDQDSDIDGNTFDKSKFTDHVVLMSNLEGDLEFRKFQSFDRTWFLKENKSQQILESVDGETSKTVTYYKLSPYSQDSKFGEGGFDKAQANRFLALFYDSLGYKVTKPEGAADQSFQWVYFDKDAFSESNNTPYFFDLKGTEFYGCILRGKAHLIAKDNTSFQATSEEVTSLQTTEELQSLDLLSKANQQNILKVYTANFNLQTRFNFDDNSRFNFYIKGISPNNYKSNLNNYLLIAKNEWDWIEEVVSVTKEPTDTAIIPEQSNLDWLRLNLSQAQEVRDMRYARAIEWGWKQVQESLDRREFDWNFSASQAKFRLAQQIGGLVTVASGRAYRMMDAMVYGPHSNAVVNEEQSNPWTGLFPKKYLSSERIFALPFNLNNLNSPDMSNLEIPNALDIWRHEVNYPGRRPRSRFSSFMSGAGGFIQMGADIGSTIYGMTHQVPEIGRRIEFDRQLTAEEKLLQSYQIDHERRIQEQRALMELRKVSTRRSKGTVNDILLIKELNKTLGNVSDIHLLTLVPSDEQLKALKAHREAWGVDCDIPDVEFEIFSGMKENIIRVKELDENGIIGIEDEILRESLRVSLHQGIKIFNVDEGEQTYTTSMQVADIDVSEYLEEVEAQKKETEKIRIQLTAAEEKEEQLKSEKEAISVELTTSRNTINALKNSLEPIKVQLAQKSSQLDALKEQKKNDDAKIRQLSNSLSQLNRKLIEAVAKIQGTDVTITDATTADPIEDPAKALATALEANKKLIDWAGKTKQSCATTEAELNRVKQELAELKKKESGERVEIEDNAESLKNLQYRLNERTKEVEGLRKVLEEKNQENTLMRQQWQGLATMRDNRNKVYAAIRKLLANKLTREQAKALDTTDPDQIIPVLNAVLNTNEAQQIRTLKEKVKEFIKAKIKYQELANIITRQWISCANFNETVAQELAKLWPVIEILTLYKANNINIKNDEYLNIIYQLTKSFHKLSFEFLDQGLFYMLQIRAGWNPNVMWYQNTKTIKTVEEIINYPDPDNWISRAFAIISKNQTVRGWTQEDGHPEFNGRKILDEFLKLRNTWKAQKEEDFNDLEDHLFKKTLTGKLKAEETDWVNSTTTVKEYDKKWNELKKLVEDN